ncbi:MAG: shikimate dehydrogenase [Flavobacteriales bacterium]|jgi:shikimate dehydrogenase
MRSFGLIGRDLSHSFSASYFTNKFASENILDANYCNCPIPKISGFQSLLKQKDWAGFNVTIPYKEAIIPYLDELSETAKAVGAVNTVCFKDGETIGHNTDVYGFSQSIKPFLESQHERALILGTGGAAKAVAYALSKLGIQIYFVSNSKTAQNIFSYKDLNVEMLSHFKLIINTTPVGTAPNIEEKAPIPYDGIGTSHLLFDLIYNPETTAFLKEGINRGASICNGLSMLQLQAEKSWELWIT